MRNAWLESRLQGEISIISDMQMTHPFDRKWRGTKEPLDECERRKWKSWLKTQHSKNKDHGIWSHHFMANRVADFIFLDSKITADGDCSHEIKRRLLLGKKSYDQPRWHIKEQRHYFANKGPFSQSYGFSSSHVWMWDLNHQESWAPKNWCFQTVMLEKTLESPLDCKEIQPVNPKENQSWIIIVRTDGEAETPTLWPPDSKSSLIRKDPDAEKDWRQEEKGTSEDEMFRWHHRLDGHEFEQPPGVGDGLGSLVCCSPWGGKESDQTEWLNWTELKIISK